MICHSTIQWWYPPECQWTRLFKHPECPDHVHSHLITIRPTKKADNPTFLSECKWCPWNSAIPEQALTSSSRFTNLKKATLNSPFPSPIPSTFSGLIPHIPPLHSPPLSPLPSPPLPSPPLLFISYTHAVHMHYPTTTNGHSHHLPLPCHACWHHN